MKTELKKRLSLAALFGVYQTILLWFFGFYTFHEPSYSEGIWLLFICARISLVQLLALWLIRKYTNYSLLWQSASFIVSSLLNALSFYFVLFIFSEYTIAYFSGFFITAVVFSVFYYLIHFYHSINSHETQFGLRTSSENNIETTVKTVYFQLENTKGRTTLEIPIHSIICFEANDNYVTIYFEDSTGKPVKKLERLSMKKVEDLLMDHRDLFKRIHKSFLINKGFVTDISGKAQAYKVHLKHLPDGIPVSRRLNIHELLN